MRLFLSVILSIIISATCVAQPKHKYTTKNTKAIKNYETALKYYDARNNMDAESELLKAIKLDDKFIEAHMLLADIYSDVKLYDASIKEYRKAISLDDHFYTKNYLLVGKVELYVGKYSEAKEDFESFLLCRDIDIVNEQRAKGYLEQSKFALNQIANPVPFDPINLGPNVNSAASEYYPEITLDDITLLFTRDVIDTLNPKQSQEDFFISEYDTASWGKAYNIGPPVNTEMNEGAPAFSPDGRFIIFTACEKYDEYGANRTGFGSCDFFYTKKVGKSWSVPENIGQPVNSGAWETQPSISSDGKTLYFIRGSKGNHNNSDIYYSTRKDDGTWSDPVNIGDEINTPLREESVFIHPDNKTLYFSSEGLMGMGGFDLYMSKKDSLGHWGKPVNLGYPINSCGNETSLFINAKGELAYFSSDRKGGYGKLDIYSFKLYDKIKPEPVNYLKGIVFDNENRSKLEAKFELINLHTGQIAIQSTSDPLTGEFLVCLPTDNDYALNVSRDGYLFYSENFSITGLHSNTEPYIKNVPLKKIKIDEVVVMKNIFFDTDKFDLKEESKIELGILITLLKNNPTLKIEISGHTDNVGEDKYNMTLSQNRAKSVYDYLIQNGINQNRLTYKGYGETKPIDVNTTEQGRANNRRTEFKVIGK